jgi:SAM-dependent methyltransferase
MKRPMCARPARFTSMVTCPRTIRFSSSSVIRSLALCRHVWCDLPVNRDVPIADNGDGAAYDPAAYGDRLGKAYDALYPADGLDTDATVHFIAALAERHPDRSVLEFGIGTGRLAIELERRGLAVAGIDASEAMVAAMRDKAPEALIDVVIGDYVSTRIDRSFAVAVLVFNNILDPRGLPAQLALFANAARHLHPGGCFVVEAFVLSDEARNGEWMVSPRYVGADHVELQVSRFDIETSTIERNLVHLRPSGPEFVAVRDVYASPGELDVMAYVNGMSRIARYSTWRGAPFTSTSRRHISVYERR